MASQIYLPLQHGDLIREEVHKVALSEGLGQEVAHGGAHGGEHTGKQQSLIWSKYSSCQDVLHNDKDEKACVMRHHQYVCSDQLWHTLSLLFLFLLKERNSVIWQRFKVWHVWVTLTSMWCVVEASSLCGTLSCADLTNVRGEENCHRSPAWRHTKSWHPFVVWASWKGTSHIGKVPYHFSLKYVLHASRISLTLTRHDVSLANLNQTC